MKKTDFFYSNCLIEAIKAKLKDWKNVRILYIPNHFNISRGGHFVWKDKTNDPNGKYYIEFCAMNNKHNHFFFKGNVSATPREEIHRMLNLALCRNKKLRKVENKFDFKFNQHKANLFFNDLGKYDWNSNDPDVSPLPKANEFRINKIDFKPTYRYEPTKLEPMVIGAVKDKSTGEYIYKCYKFDKNGDLITNGDLIEWWKWRLFNTPDNY